MRLLIAGASGMVGSETVRLAISDPQITRVTAIVRKPIAFDPKVNVVIHNDFLNYNALKDIFADHDACIWCLGISQSMVNAAKYFTITHDYVVAAAKAMLVANPSIVFTFLSAMGADTSAKTKIRFGRVKGQAESTLMSLGLPHLYIFRPGAIVASRSYGQPGIHKRIERFMMRSFSTLFPGLSVYVSDLAGLMLRVTKTKGNKMMYSQLDIRHNR